MRAVDYRADIDGLRAIAILLVVIFHFDILSAGEGGFIGVDVFFVISGFLITGIIARALDAGTFRIGDFLYRRVRRLYPAVLATLILYLAFGYVFFLPDLFEELAVQALLSQIYAINIYFWRTIDYFGLQAGSAPLLHMWSLAVEEQFYLLFPVFCLICHRILRGRLLWPLIAITALSFALGLAASGWKPQAAFYLLPTRAWELSAGGALALLLRDWTPPRFVAVAAGPIGLALIVAALAVHTPAMAVPGWFALLPVTGAMLLLVTGAHPDAPVARVLALKPMVWVGLISYPLYLVHWPVIIALDEMVEVAHLGWRLFGLGLSFALAWAIWKVVETPVRTSRVLPRPAPFLVAAGGTTLAVVVVAALIARDDGAPGRFSPETREMLAYSDDLPTPYRDCDFKGGGGLEATCRLGAPDAAPTALVIGDSHARALAGALDLWLAGRGEAAHFTFAHSCVPVRGVGQPRCVGYAEAMMTAATASDQIEDVILVSAWRQLFEGGIAVDGRWRAGDAVHEPFAEALLRDAEKLAAGGKRMIIVDPLFASPRHAPKTAARNIAFGRDWSIDQPLAAHQETFAPLFAAFDRATAASDARRVSLLGPFCDGGLCRGLWRGRPVFTDNNHLAFGLSGIVASEIARQMSD